MTKTYKFVSDSGHGWLGVTLADIKELEMLYQISRYSYLDKESQIVWLEEDRDMGIFMESAQSKGWNVKIIEESVNGMSPIRNLPGY